ncbi:MAG TPA: hypothetical protein VFU43_07440 [Streptosporangiaceae bacterium]|nr:hypothetical protein [Streptosporangiaceae bacterium]
MSEYPAHGRTRSWFAVLVIVAGFGVGGVALTLGPTWWLFWTAAGVVAVGGVAALFSNILADVVLDDPRVLDESMHYSILGDEPERELRGGEHGEQSAKPTARDPADWPHG